MFTTSDIAFASFLVLRGLSISRVEKKGRKVYWHFNVPQETIDTLVAAWPSSESSKFYATYQTLKMHIKTGKNAS